MQGDESFYPADWLRIAEKDLGRVEHLLSVQDAEAAGFFLQQAVEKFLKAFLLSKGWKLERIHDLEALLNMALSHDSSLERFRAACQLITGFYLVERYPFASDIGLTENDIRNSLEQVKELIDELKAKLT
ncbi:MAG: HEPN domain-containing protein [Planctomycetota bacterium]|jgi:HEPN domain-containing protein